MLKRGMVLLGSPGGGKGTIARKILSDFPLYDYISSSELLSSSRGVVVSHKDKQVSVGEIMRSGEMVTDDLLVELLSQRFATSRAAKILLVRPSSHIFSSIASLNK